jgi:superfamily II DNA or RNA helicase
MIELTERLLGDAGGWQALKLARGLHSAGRVSGASYAPPLLQGRVRQGDSELKSGLKILSKTNIENLCTCRESRQHGRICEHSLAVGLEVMKPSAVAAPVTAPAPAPLPQSPALSQATESPLPFLNVSDAPNAGFLELYFILAPNLSSGWEKNAVTVGAEVQLAGKRILLSALDCSKQYSCSQVDLRCIEAWCRVAGPEALQAGKGRRSLPGMAVLDRESFAQLMGHLAGNPRVTLGKDQALQIFGADRMLRPLLNVQRGPDGGLRLKTTLPESARLLEAPTGFWVWEGAVVRPVASGLPGAYRELLSREIRIPAEAADRFLAREMPALGAYLTLDAEGGQPLVATNPRAAAGKGASGRLERADFFLKIEGSLNHLVAELECRRGDRRTSVGGAGYRGGDAEHGAALERLEASGFSRPDAKGQMVLKGEPAILAFFARELPRLEQEWTVEIGARFEHVTRDVQRITPRLEVRSSGENWFELQVEIGAASGERFSAAEIQRLLQSGRNSVRLKSGKLAVFNADLLDEFQQVLNDCSPQQRQPGQYRIDRQHAAYLEGIAAENQIAIQSPAEWKQWAGGSRQLERLTRIPLNDLEEVLRPYQKQGVYWLHFLAQNGWGGILADEMGLGKTIQMLAFLRSLKGRALVVCPSSLVFNWQREAARFTPQLRVLVLEGPKRHERFNEIDSADLVITSYPLLRRDADRFRGLAFAAMVLDEAQHIKNPDSQNAQAAQVIRAKNRFVLTGTPVENSVRDIWSLMNFLMPGYLGTRADFKERFEQVIGNESGGPERRRLLQRLRPFILRRKKETVAPELPEKIEQVSFCELHPDQREVYTRLLDSTRRQVSELASEKDRNKSRILMLTALLRLRQVCCDLRLLDLPGAEKAEGSAKLELLDELLQESLDGGHRVIVFSQFVSMLNLIRQQLVAAETPFCYLDGSTKDRQKVVDEFQTGQIPVFLMSLKAGGVGLNLTAADTVIHFDPWWNPAVEAQATDRAHRMGQKSVVTSYKLIARNTIEEKILALQSKKRALIDATVENEQPLMEGLGIEDIELLIS